LLTILHRRRSTCPCGLDGLRERVNRDPGEQSAEQPIDLRHVIAQIANTPQTRLIEFLPWNWYPELARQKAA
jgi:hypothetical protein